MGRSRGFVATAGRGASARGPLRFRFVIRAERGAGFGLEVGAVGGCGRHAGFFDLAEEVRAEDGFEPGAGVHAAAAGVVVAVGVVAAVLARAAAILRAAAAVFIAEHMRSRIDTHVTLTASGAPRCVLPDEIACKVVKAGNALTRSRRDMARFEMPRGNLAQALRRDAALAGECGALVGRADGDRQLAASRIEEQVAANA